MRPSRDHGDAAGVPTPTGLPSPPLPQPSRCLCQAPTPPLVAPWGCWERKATQRSVHLPEGHSDSSILCPAPMMLPPQKGTLYETWQDLSTGQEELAPWFFFFLSPEALKGREQGYQSPPNPPTGYYSFTQSLLICQDTTADTFSTAFVPEMCTSIFLVNAVSSSLGNSWC